FEAQDYEWIEIFNRGGAAIDLTDWKFYENETNHGLTAFRGDLVIEPGEYAIIANKGDKFAERYPNFSGTIIDSSWSNLNESGEAIALKSSDSAIVESFTYISASNYSLERANPNLADYTSANWQEHSSGNTAGFQNLNYNVPADNQDQQNNQTNEPSAPASSAAGQSVSSSQNQPPVAKAGSDVVANIGAEIIFDASLSYDPEGQGISYMWNFGNGAVSKEAKAKYKYDYPGTYIATLTVSDGSLSALDQIRIIIYPTGVVINEFLPNPEGADEDSEWIELKNLSDSIIDLSGWQIGNQDEKTKPFIIPENTFILPNGFLLPDGKTAKITLGNQKGSVKLLYPNGELAEEVKYEIPAKDGYSAARKSDGAFVWTKNPTPGMNNILLSDSLKTTSSARSSEKVVQENLKISAFVSVAGKSVGVSAADKTNFSNLLIKSAQAKIVSDYDEKIAAENEKKAAENETSAATENKPKSLQALEARINSFFDGRSGLFLILMSAAALALFGLSRKLYKS
ncbi:MAG: ABC transporter, substrate-binding protein, partial [Candidatus Azambacteria bacterium GW2011_GWB1_46_27]